MRLKSIRKERRVCNAMWCKSLNCDAVTQHASIDLTYACERLIILLFFFCRIIYLLHLFSPWSNSYIEGNIWLTAKFATPIGMFQWAHFLRSETRPFAFIDLLCLQLIRNTFFFHLYWTLTLQLERRGNAICEKKEVRGLEGKAGKGHEVSKATVI